LNEKYISKIYSRKKIEYPINTIKNNYLIAIRQVIRKNLNNHLSFVISINEPVKYIDLCQIKIIGLKLKILNTRLILI
jgi:hypothetical protein